MIKNTLSIQAAQAGSVSLGKLGRVNRMGFGAMRLTGSGIWGDPKNIEEAKAVLRRVIDLGINFIDTADSYGPEVSENLIAQALYPYPKELVIATKGGLVRPGPDQWIPVGRPEYLMQCVEMSLRRLKKESIELYQLHAVDPLVPIEDSLGALKQMQSQGKIRAIGLSNVTVPEIKRARKVVDVVSVQNRYNLLDRGSEEVVDYCSEHKIAFIPWFPVAKGELTKPRAQLEKVARSKNATVAQVALAWLLNRSAMMLPIPGTSSIKHLEENVAAANLQLSPEEFQGLK